MKREMLVVLAASAAGGAFALADDFAPPPWRGDPLSVEVEWEFSQPFGGVQITPDSFSAVGGGPHVLHAGVKPEVVLDNLGNWAWVPGDGDGGITGAPGTLVSFQIICPNWEDQEPWKFIRIQFTFDGPPPVVVQGTGFIGAVPFPANPLGPPVVVDPRHYYQDFIILPNPWWEVFVVEVPPGTVLDEIYFDTISIPSPGAWALAALAGVVAWRRRR